MEPANIKLNRRRKRPSPLTDENFRILFDNMTEGFSINEIVYDRTGKPSDFRILEINPAFERLTGLKRDVAIGRLASEVFPGLEPFWIQTVAQVVLTGEPTQFENYTETLGRYYRVYAYRPAPGQFAVIFTDITERKQVEDRLAYLASFPERNPNPIVEVDQEGKVHYSNPAASKLFPDLIAQGPAHPWLTDLDSIFRQFHLDHTEIITRDVCMGDRFYQQTLNYIRPDHLIRIYGLEITKRKKAEAALQESEQLLSRAQEISHLGSWELDLVKNRITWSDETYRIFGYQPQEFAATYEAFLDAVHPDDRAAVDAAYSGSIRDGRDFYEVEHRLVKRSTGEVRIVHEKCVHFRDESGNVIRSEGMVHDITEQKKSEEALRLSEEKYRTMVETAAEGIALVKPDGTFFYINQQMADMLGYPMKEVIGKTGTDFMYDNQQSLVQQLRNELHKGDILHGEFHFRRKDGSDLWSRYNASPIFNENGEHVSNLAMHTDITKHKRAEQALLQAYDELELRVQNRTRELQNALRNELETHDQLVQAEKFAAVGRLLASITHEINNPLQTIKNCLYLSQLDTIRGTPVYDALDTAVAETNRLSNLVAQLREIYRPPTHGLTRPVDLPALVSETQTLLAGYLLERHVTWQVMPPDINRLALCKVEGVPNQLKQVFLNICLNAIDAMEPAGGRLLIDFKFSQDDSQVGICFKDSGPGLPPEVKAKLFEPFTTTKEKGLGLGLVICYDIIQKHHGHIEVESEPGEGAAFIIWLPACREAH